MKYLASVLMMCVCLSAGAQKPDPAKPHSVVGLELTPPVVRTRPGVVVVRASVTVKGDKTKVVWDVEAQFEDDVGEEFEWEVRDGGRAVQVVIPDSKGLVRVTALAIVDGEPTSERPAKTYIDIDYKPREKKLGKAEQPKQDDGPKLEKAKGVARAPIRDVYLVVDQDRGDVNVNAKITSPALKNKMKADGLVEAKLLWADSPDVARAGLTRAVAGAGGPTCVVVVTTENKVRKAFRPKPSDTVEDITREIAD